MDAYFETSGLDPKGGARMALKSAVILSWVVASWALLLLWAASWWTALPLSVSLGLGLAAVGFAVMHDGGHGAYSRRPWVNRLSAGVVDLMGGSSYFWHFKHNVLHHSFTNVVGVDNDIDAGPVLRVAHQQPRRWFHRYQHLYVLPLVGLFFAPKWALWDDFITWIRGADGKARVPRPRGRDALQLLGGKLFHLGWALVLPLALHPPLPVLVCYLVVMAVLGITLATVFQLAHVVEGTAFPGRPAPQARLERPFFEHQLATTADFAQRNRLLTWYVGGLNYQVEHHLFPRVSHLHYPALARIVEEVCRERGVPYLRHETVAAALASHVRHLRRLGREDAPAPV